MLSILGLSAFKEGVHTIHTECNSYLGLNPASGKVQIFTSASGRPPGPQFHAADSGGLGLPPSPSQLRPCGRLFPAPPPGPQPRDLGSQRRGIRRAPFGSRPTRITVLSSIFAIVSCSWTLFCFLLGQKSQFPLSVLARSGSPHITLLRGLRQISSAHSCYGVKLASGTACPGVWGPSFQVPAQMPPPPGSLS